MRGRLRSGYDDGLVLAVIVAIVVIAVLVALVLAVVVFAVLAMARRKLLQVLLLPVTIPILELATFRLLASFAAVRRLFCASVRHFPAVPVLHGLALATIVIIDRAGVVHDHARRAVSVILPDHPAAARGESRESHEGGNELNRMSSVHRSPRAKGLATRAVPEPL